MKKNVKKNRNLQIIVGFVLTLQFFQRLSLDGLSALAVFSGSVGILAFIVAYKSHKEIIKNDKS